MDAITFINERKRMCNAQQGCPGCTAFRIYGCIFGFTSGSTASEQVEVVEEWSATHQPKTRQDVFLEQYPEASVGRDGILDVCPAPIDAKYRGENGGCGNIHKRCRDCFREYWLQEVE